MTNVLGVGLGLPVERSASPRERELAELRTAVAEAKRQLREALVEQERLEGELEPLRAARAGR